MSVGIGRQNIIVLFGNKEAAQLHFWEYINIYIYLLKAQGLGVFTIFFTGFKKIRI
jgi:hypothetical protein